MDDVKALLTEFADRAVDGLPPADMDADVARGRRALRRIRARRRVTGVLCIAAATAAVLAVGNQTNWWDPGNAQVAGGSEETPTAAAGSEPEAVATPMSAGPSPQTGDTYTMYSAGAVSLVANKETWSNIDCSLAPQGWAAQRATSGDHVLLMPPNVRTADLKPGSGLELRALPEARSLEATRATKESGKVFHFGTTDGREAGQVLLGERWLLVQLPAGNKDWNEELLRRFMGSCQVN
ncbi:hypothetical protein [Kribbella sp. NPDC023855]|uniref:hypothetical protein n=1 Tax=Kribbella sp. NPDC023855 TaxID=3154698 RepID=UPI0033E57589